MIATPETCREHGGDHHAGCPGCRAYSTSRYHRRFRMRLYGIDNLGRVVPSGRTRGKLEQLIDAGMTQRQIADAAGITRQQVYFLLHHPDSGTTAGTEAAILAVQPLARRLHGHVPAVGTIRRIQALAAIGHSLSAQAGWYGGVTPQAVSDLVRNRQWVTEAMAEKVADAYRAWSMIPGTGRGAARARGEAQRRGWAPPLAWDDDTIDDPDAQPNLGADTDDEPDDEVVARIRAGQQVPALPADRLEAIRRILASGRGISEICRRLHVSGATARKLAYQAVTGPDDRQESAA